MHKNLPARLLPHLFVGIATFGIAIVIRLFLLGNGLDVGTANLVFIAVLVFGIVIYWAFSSVLTDLLMPLFDKLFSRREKSDHVSEPKNLVPVISPTSTMIDIAVQQFCDYSRIVLTRHITEEEFTLLFAYIRTYAEGGYLENVHQIDVKGLSNPDLYHYGWNMWYHFSSVPRKQDDLVQWLKSVFFSLEYVETVTIKGKLTGETKSHYRIELCKDIVCKYLNSK